MATMTVTNTDGTKTKIELGQKYNDFMLFKFPDFINRITLELAKVNLLVYQIHRNEVGEYVNAVCPFTMDTTDDLDYIITE